MRAVGHCQKCDFWNLFDRNQADQPALGFCQRYPPSIAPTAAERAAGEDRWNFIVTAAEDGCGEQRMVGKKSL